MRLENLLALTGAKLVNNPCVNNFEGIIFDANKIKRGDLYVAYDIAEVNIAVQNGAYGILYDTQLSVTDEEIAWIKVLDVDLALEKLLRFKLIENDTIAYECDEIVLKLALQINTNKNFLVVNEKSIRTFRQLWNIEPRTIILFCPALYKANVFAYIKKIYTDSKKHIDIIEQTLFETSFIYNNKYYERQLISPFFIPYLETLFHLYDTLNINFKLNKFTSIDNFEAIFTNKNLEIKDFGASDKVLIFEKNSSLIDKEISFLQKNASWANIIYLVPNSVHLQNNTNAFSYTKEKDIMDILKREKFHFALVVGVDKSILNTQIQTQEQLLFDI